MSHRDWNIQVHQRALEPLDDVINQLIKQNGPISPVRRISPPRSKARGAECQLQSESQVKPVLLAYRSVQGALPELTLRDIFPADESKYTRQDGNVDLGSLSLDRREAVQGRLPRGIADGQTSDAVDWVGALFNSFGVVMVDERTT